MKILMITGDSSLAEGRHGAFYNTLEEFHKHWDRIDVICPKASNAVVSNIFNNVFIHSSPQSKILQPFWILKKGHQIYKEQNFDLITVHDFPPFYNGIGAKWLWSKIKVPYITEIHHIVGHPRAANLKEFIYRIIFKLFIKDITSKNKAIRVVNQHEAPEYLKKCGINPNKIIYIPSLYLDLDIFKPMNLEKEHDLIFVGRLESNKGIDLFIDAAKKLNSKALIVGKGALSKQIENLTRNTNIKLHGWAKDPSEVSELINKSKLLIMTSYNEGGPRVVFESLACGTPVVATPVGLVSDFKSVITVTDWNVNDIASSIKNLFEDAQSYEKIKTGGLETVKQFDKQITVQNYADKLKSLI